MAKPVISTKHVAIDRANTQMVAAVGVATFVTIFCLFAIQTMFSSNAYLLKVISEKKTANSQLDKNIDAFNSLVKSYKSFDGKDPNIIGGAKAGTGDKDGNNARIVLDALPSSYDFPALTSSIEKVLKDRGFSISSISGTDDQANQESNIVSASPKSVEMPFTFSIDNANYQSVQDLFVALQHSIRPIQIDKVDVSGNSGQMTLNVSAHTYYQPGKNVELGKKEVK